MLKFRLLGVSLLCMCVAAAALAAAPAQPAQKSPQQSPQNPPPKAQPQAFQKAPPRVEQQLVGLWQDREDPENIIRFQPDHTVKVFVSRSDGEARKLRWISGTWSLSADMVLRLMLDVPLTAQATAKMEKVYIISLTKAGMEVRSGREVVGRQRRIPEAVLKQYLW